MDYIRDSGNEIMVTCCMYSTKGEVTRRENLVDNMTAKEGQLNKAFKEEPSARSATSRDALIGSQPIGVNTNPWLDTEHEETRGLTNTELMQTHQEVIRREKNPNLVTDCE